MESGFAYETLFEYEVLSMVSGGGYERRRAHLNLLKLQLLILLTHLNLQN